MLLSEIFKPSNIKIKLESGSKEELFEEIINFLVDVEKLDNRDEILNSLWDRERKMTTGIAPNIAIPHINLGNIKKTLGAIGISQKGIDYDSLDNKPVHVVFFLLGNKNNPAEHLRTLKNLSMMLSSEDFYSQIVKCGSSEKINELLIEYEESLNIVNGKK